MNIPCEQLKSDLSLDIAIDEVLSQKEMFGVITETLGKDNCDYIKFTNTHKVLRYKKEDGNYELFLILAVSFMGGNHQISRHRVQLKPWYKELYEEYKDIYNIRIIGVYHYKGNIDNFIVFSETSAEILERKKKRVLNANIGKIKKENPNFLQYVLQHGILKSMIKATKIVKDFFFYTHKITSLIVFVNSFKRIYHFYRYSYL